MESSVKERSKLIRLIVALGPFPKEVQALVSRLTLDVLPEAWTAAFEMALSDCPAKNDAAELIACWCTAQEIRRIAKLR